MKYGINYIESRDKPGLAREDMVIHEGGNSGYQAINLAYHMGAREIALLGFDMGATGQGHWFGNHPGHMQVQSPFKTWVKCFDQLAADLKSAGVEVINYSRQTALECFERRDLESL